MSKRKWHFFILVWDSVVFNERDITFHLSTVVNSKDKDNNKDNYHFVSLSALS